jgi:hypothetical protein
MLAWLLCLGTAAGQSLAPTCGLLVLKNGQVIEGEVMRAGDYFLVTRGEGVELRMEADKVECVCASLAEAYEFKVRRLPPASARSRIELARWCLRHDLMAQCRDQLAEAELVEPNDVHVKDLKQRLKALDETPLPSTPARVAPTLPVESLEQTLAALPRGSVERFGAVVQPILLNRCAANQCHGPNSKSEFRLLRPPQGQTVSRRFTQRNLYATLKQLSPSSPDQSPLVLKAGEPHGSSLAPLFDKHSANQLAELVAWARLATTSSAPPASIRPTSILPGHATLSQAPTDRQGAPVGPVENSASVVKTMRPSSDAPAPINDRATAAPRDPFDPEIFNRRFHR